MPKALLELDHFLPYRLSRAAEAVSRDFATLYRERYGMTRPEWRVLATVGQFGRITATAIGRHSSLHKTKVSRAVVALEKRRWISRSTDTDDRRIEHLTLTREGVACYRALVTIAKAYERRLIAALGDEQSAQLAHGLDAVEAALTIASKPDHPTSQTTKLPVGGEPTGKR
ncbi:MarR family winged helix-turn-helix transcriptional regulator [Pararhizobium haloflavum]|uniref:MarR family winged helix-turn-helix transcriptional regulator n=1 Tax=Pararhizobium haloflavum TaxID=2037914 RepID=UPI000C182539|nr:MarR family transcriptional regulator [Pararhizobium haloflavum]